jgi:hypothetical protein
MNQYAKIEQLCHLWKGLETTKSWYQDYPEILTIIEGAITRLRLEIIIVCQRVTEP